MTNENIKSEKLALYWLCNQTGKTLPAGVAFFNEPQGDYRLKIDALPDDKLIFLKVMSAKDGTVYYRVESVVKRAGVATHRSQIGTGYSKSESGFPVFMDIGPYTKTLMMEAV